MSQVEDKFSLIKGFNQAIGSWAQQRCDASVQVAIFLILVMKEEQKPANLKPGLETSYGNMAPISKHVRDVMEGFTDFLNGKCGHFVLTGGCPCLNIYVPRRCNLRGIINAVGCG